MGLPRLLALNCYFFSFFTGGGLHLGGKFRYEECREFKVLVVGLLWMGGNVRGPWATSLSNGLFFWRLWEAIADGNDGNGNGKGWMVLKM